MNPPKIKVDAETGAGPAAACMMINVHGTGVCGKPATHKSGHASKPNYWCEHHGIILGSAGYKITRIKPPHDDQADRPEADHEH